jgi:hypothetical protein
LTRHCGAGAHARQVSFGANQVGRTSRPHHILLYLLLFILLYLYVSAFRDTFIDDAFIQFNYAESLAHHGNWGFYADQPANTATSPLNILLLAGFTLITGSAINAAVLIITVLFFILFITIQQISRSIFGDMYFGIFCFIGLLTNLLLLSCLGMETILFVVLFVLSLAIFFQERNHLLAGTLAFLTLARPDGFLLFIIFVFVLRKAGPLKFSFIYFAVLIPWYLYSWIHLGSFVPDTLLLKIQQQSWSQSSFGSGLFRIYFPTFKTPLILSFLLLPFAFWALQSKNLRARTMVILVLSFAALHFVLYSLLKIPPYHWYYSHLAMASVISGSAGIALGISNKLLRWILLVLPVSGVLYQFTADGFKTEEAPIHTNWATHQQYREIGEWLKHNTKPTETFIMGGEVGTLAYYSHRYLLNNFSDPWLLQHTIQRPRSSWLRRKILSWNFLWRKTSRHYPPASYVVEHSATTTRRLLNPQIVQSWSTASRWIPAGTLYLRKTKRQRI